MLIFRHYCQCKPGFKAYQDPSLDGATICIDENECELGTHTCHPNAQCWNTAGSYQCYCGYDASQNCSSGKYSVLNSKPENILAQFFSGSTGRIFNF